MKFPAAFVVLLALLAAPLRADDILLRTGRDIMGVQIQAETFDKIEYKKRNVGSVQSVDASDVREVRYGRTSADYAAAVSLRDRGEMAQAAGMFLAAADDDSLPDHVRATALVEAADALFAGGNLDQALSVYGQLLASHGRTRHLARALLGRGKTLLYKKQYDEAATAFQALRDAAESKDLGETWALEAEFFQLLAAEDKGQTDVLAGYRDLRSRTAGSAQGIANQCALRIGRVLLSGGKLDEAWDLFSEIIDSRLETGDEVVAGAYNGRGRVVFQQALAALKQDPQEALELFRQARLDFLRVYVNYKGVIREQPEALYWAGQCFLNVGSQDSTEAQAENTGRVLLNRCKTRYPGSPWGQKAASSP